MEINVSKIEKLTRDNIIEIGKSILWNNEVKVVNIAIEFKDGSTLKFFEVKNYP